MNRKLLCGLFFLAFSLPFISTKALSVSMNTSELGAYQRATEEKIISSCQAISDYRNAIIYVSISPLGEVKTCEVLKSTGSKSNDDQIIEKVKSLVFPKMMWADALTDEMQLRFPLERNTTPRGSYITDGKGGELSIGNDEYFAYNGNGSIKMGGDPHQLIEKPQPQASNYGPEDRKYDERVEHLMDEFGTVLQFEGVQNVLRKKGPNDHEKNAADYLKAGRTLAAADEYLIAAVEPLTCGSFDKAKPLVDKSVTISDQLSSLELQLFAESMTNLATYLNTRYFSAGNNTGILYISQKADDLNSRTTDRKDQREIKILHVLAAANERERKFQDAEVAAKKTLALVKAAPQFEIAEVQNAYGSLSRIYSEEHKDADELENDKELVSYLKSRNTDNLCWISPLSTLLEAQLKQNKMDDAKQSTTEIVQILTPYLDNQKSIPQSPLWHQGLSAVESAAGSISTGGTNKDRYQLVEQLLKVVYLIRLQSNGSAFTTTGLDPLCNSLVQNGKAEEAVHLYNLAIKKLEQESSPESELQLGQVRRRLADALKSSGKVEEATKIDSDIAAQKENKQKELLENAEKKIDELSKDPASIELIIAKLDLAQKLIRNPETQARGITLITEALSVYDKKTENSDRVNRLLGFSANALLLTDLNSDLAKRCFELIERRAPNGANNVLPQAFRFVRGNEGQRVRAEHILESLLEIRQAATGKDSFKLTPILQAMVFLEHEMDHNQRVEDLDQQLLAIYEKHYGSDSPNVANLLLTLASAKINNGHFAAAKSDIKRATEIAGLEKNDCPAKLDISSQLSTVGISYIEAGKLVDAQQVIKQSLNAPGRKQFSAPQFAIEQYVAKCAALKDLSSANNFFESVIKIEQEKKGIDDQETNSLRKLYADFLLEQISWVSSNTEKKRLFSESEKTFKTLAASYSKSEGESSPTLKNALKRRLFLLTAVGLSEEAKKLQDDYKMN